MIGNSNDETNFRHKLLLTNRQVANLHKAFANNSSVNITSSKTQTSKIIQSVGFLGRLLWNSNENWFSINEKCASTIS